MMTGSYEGQGGFFFFFCHCYFNIRWRVFDWQREKMKTQQRDGINGWGKVAWPRGSSLVELKSRWALPGPYLGPSSTAESPKKLGEPAQVRRTLTLPLCNSSYNGKGGHSGTRQCSLKSWLCLWMTLASGPSGSLFPFLQSGAKPP